MYPGRFWLGLGSGEAINEHVVAGYWPEAPERINRMFEAIEIITKLFNASLAIKPAGSSLPVLIRTPVLNRLSDVCSAALLRVNVF